MKHLLVLLILLFLSGCNWLFAAPSLPAVGPSSPSMTMPTMPNLTGLNWFAVVGLALAAVAAFNGRTKIATSVAVGCVAVIAISFYFKLVALLGIICVVGGFVAVVLSLFTPGGFLDVNKIKTKFSFLRK
jgi:hypothetical protein